MAINDIHELPSTSLSLARNIGLLQQRNVLVGGKKKSKGSSATFSIPSESVEHSKRAKLKTARTWTVTVVCLGKKYSKNVPTPLEKDILFKAGLEPNKIQFYTEDSEKEVLDKISSDCIKDNETIALNC